MSNCGTVRLSPRAYSLSIELQNKLESPSFMMMLRGALRGRGVNLDGLSDAELVKAVQLASDEYLRRHRLE